jgi:hypothetical protein
LPLKFSSIRELLIQLETELAWLRKFLLKSSPSPSWLLAFPLLHDASLSRRHKNPVSPVSHISLKSRTTSPVSLCSPRSISCAHTRWKSRASGLPPLHRVHLLGWRVAIVFLRSVCNRYNYSLFIFTASFLHCIDRDDYTNKAPCFHWVQPALPHGIITCFIILLCFLSKPCWLAWSTWCFPYWLT